MIELWVRAYYYVEGSRNKEQVSRGNYAAGPTSWKRSDFRGK